MDIEQNLGQVRSRIGQAALAAGRSPDEIKLLAVSKTMPSSVIAEAWQAGQRVFAENRVQEWQEKVSLLPPDCEWHLIGRLQTNKVKYLDGRVTLIHSLDRFSLLAELEKQGFKQGQTFSTLLQVNTARDQAKAGLLKEETEDFLTAVKDYPHVRVLGLMTIGALEASTAETQGFFRELRLLRDSLQQRVYPGVEMRELSMGMSQDFELAIAEGATMVRVGRQIFGAR